MRQRPQFFIDLERENAGESVEEEYIPEAPIAIIHDLAAKGRAILAYEEAQARDAECLQNMTATGAMIAADYAQYRVAMMAQCTQPQLAYMARQQMQSSRDGYGFGSAFGSLGSLLGL